MGTAECDVHKLVVDVAAFRGDKVLLVKYRDPTKYDGQRGWFLPDDYLDFEEHPGDAASRILREQAGIAAKVDALSHLESCAGGPTGAWHLIFHYKVNLPEKGTLVPGPNVSEARWFPLSKLPPKGDVAHGGWALDILAEMIGKENPPVGPSLGVVLARYAGRYA